MVVTVIQDARCRPCTRMVIWLSDLKKHIADADAAANDVRHALENLMKPIWIERYLQNS